MFQQRQLSTMRLLETNPEMTQRELAEALSATMAARILPTSIGRERFGEAPVLSKTPQKVRLILFAHGHQDCRKNPDRGQLFAPRVNCA